MGVMLAKEGRATDKGLSESSVMSFFVGANFMTEWNSFEPSPSNGFCQEFYRGDKGMHTRILLALYWLSVFYAEGALASEKHAWPIVALHDLCKLSPRNCQLLKLCSVRLW